MISDFGSYTSNSSFFFIISVFLSLFILLALFETMQDMEFTILWVEEMLIEANLIFDILFLSFYDNFSPCTLDQWKSLSNLFRVSFSFYSLPTVSALLELLQLSCFYISGNVGWTL